MHRRDFLGAAAASAFLLAHGTPRIWAGGGEAARILGLRLATAASLEEMKAFYEGALGLPVLSMESGELTVGGGATPITFYRVDEGAAPFYHFAFNIPENKILTAREWQLERSELLPVPERLRDDRFPGDVVHFRNWNAHSVFFLDPGGNVVEYIARHDLQNEADGPFSVEDIRYASEIAMATDDVPDLGDRIQQAFDLPQYRSASEEFRAIGDEHGLLLVFRRGRNVGLASKTPRKIDVFPAEVRIRDVAGRSFSSPGSPYSISGG